MRLCSLLALGVVSAFLAACGDSGSSAPKPTPSTPGSSATAQPDTAQPSGPTRPRIVVLARGEKSLFWAAARAGALKAASEHRAFDVVWKEPSAVDPAAQAKALEAAAAPGVVALVVAPAGETLQSPLEALAAKKLPIVLLDSDLSSEKFVSSVITDPDLAGRLARDHVSMLLGPMPIVGLLRTPGPIGTARENGFIKIAPVSENSHHFGGAEDAPAAVENLTSGDASQKCQAVFCTDLATTEALVKALQGAADITVPRVGTEASPVTLAAIEKGTLDALVVPDGFKLGYLGVKTAIRAAKEERNLPKQQDAGAVVVTKENLASPELKPLLHPDEPK